MIQALKNLKYNLYQYRILYKKYITQRTKFSNTNIRYYNYWDLKNIENDWFYRFINHNNLNDKNKIINIISVFGQKELILLIKGIKVFFTGENLNPGNGVYPKYLVYNDHYNRKVDLALGFNYEIAMGSNYLRFPLWIHYFVPPESTLASLKVLIAKYNAVETRIGLDRDRYAVHISKRDNTSMRSELIRDLNKIDLVCCAGKFMNNSNELKEVFMDDKLAFLKRFKFNVCPENSDTDGYVTEKLFHAIMAGCIPIYWGSINQPEPGIINPKAVVFYDPNDKERSINQVRNIMSCEKAYQEFINIPPFKENAAEVIWEYLSRLKIRLQDVIEKN